MKKTLLVVLGLVLSCLPALSQTSCRYSYRPASRPHVVRHAAAVAPVVAAPVVPVVKTHHHYDTVIKVADVVVPLFDYDVKDVFIFTGPPPAIPPRLVLGVDGNNKEVRAGTAATGVASASATAAMSAPASATASAPVVADVTALRALIAKDQREESALHPILGYEEGAVIATPSPAPAPATAASAGAATTGSEATQLIAQLTPTLVSRCASCHAQGERRVKGGFTLLVGGKVVAGVNWKRVLDYVSSPDGKTRPGCPPRGDPLGEADLTRIRRLVVVSK